MSLHGLFADPPALHATPTVIEQTDGITGGTLATPEVLYGSPVQTLIGWPGLHLFGFIHRDKWSPTVAQEFLQWWMPASLPGGCGCGSHFADMLQRIPMDCSTWESFFATSVAWHNDVNARIDSNGSHPQLSPAQAQRIWSRIAAAWPVAWWRDLPTPEIKPGRRLVITVAAGPAREWLRITRPWMERYANRCDADFVALESTTQSWWGLEKFRVYPYACAYDEILFLDADVLVGPDVPDIFEWCSASETMDNIGMHDDYGHLPSIDWIAPERANVLECQGLVMPADLPSCLNTGVVYSSYAARSIWAPPKLPIPTTHCAEQFLIEQRVLEISFNQTPDDRRSHIGLYPFQTQWNLQWWMPDFDQRIKSDAIIHLASAPNKTHALSAIVEDPRFSAQ